MALVIDQQILNKYDVAGPRYTSYPTAPEWSDAVTSQTYVNKLCEFGTNDKSLSLYIHVPFCESLCYFCACHKVIRPKELKYGNEFLDHLDKEVTLIADLIGRRKVIRQFHWGGGTPTYLSESQMEQMFKIVHDRFEIDFSGEVAIEVDPRTVTPIKLKVLRQLGFNRISMGIQDFDPKVQKDINRVQPYEQVLKIYECCRELGFASVNFDLVYGLPYQTSVTFRDAIEKVIRMRPDRIALYSFAYVPWMSKPQNTFNVDAIAKHEEKLEIFIQSRQSLIDGGYQAIAMDHFALETDELSQAFREGRLHRNFMGYTLKPADEFIGLGPSAIGFLEKAYVQNVKGLPEYYEMLDKGILPIERGKVLSEDDSARQWVINSIMCRFRLDKGEFAGRFGKDFDQYFAEEARHIRECVEDGLITADALGFSVTELGRTFVRNIAMGFDWYLRQKNGHKRFSRTI